MAKKKAPKKREAPHLRIRLHPELLKDIERARTDSGRTTTGEITQRLMQSFADEHNIKTLEDTVRDRENDLSKARERIDQLETEQGNMLKQILDALAGAGIKPKDQSQ